MPKFQRFFRRGFQRLDRSAPRSKLTVAPSLGLKPDPSPMIVGLAEAKLVAN